MSYNSILKSGKEHRIKSLQVPSSLFWGSNEVSLLRLSRRLHFRICLILGFQMFSVRKQFNFASDQTIHCSSLPLIATNRELCIVTVYVTVKHFNWRWRTVWYKLNLCRILKPIFSTLLFLSRMYMLKAYFMLLNLLIYFTKYPPMCTAIFYRNGFSLDV
jgi:hypothetical protein